MGLKLLVSLGAVLIASTVLFVVEASVDQVMMQLLTLVALLAAIMGASVAARPDKRVPFLCDPVFLFNAFNAQFYLIGSLAMAAWGLSPIAFFRAPDPSAALPPMVGCILMTMAFLAGQSLQIGAVIADFLPSLEPTSRKLSRDWAIVGLCLLAVGGCVAWIEWQGGLMARLSMGYGQGRSGDAMFQIAFNALLAGTLLAAWPIIERTARVWHRVFFFAVMGFAIPFFGVIHGARKYLFFLFFGLLTMWLLRRGFKALPKLRIAILAGLLLLFFAGWGALRGKPFLAHVGQQQDVNYGSSRTFRQGYINSVADPFGVACMVWQLFPAQEPFRHGSTTLVAVLGFIPRAIWPGKPIAIGKELTRYYVGPFYEPTTGFSVTPTLPGEFFINFGWAGVIGGGLMFGLICRIAIAYAARGMADGVQRQAARVLLPAVFVMNLGEIRADTAQVLAANAMTMLPMLAVLAMFRLDGGEASPSPVK